MKLACCVPCEVEFIIGTNIGLLKVEKLSKLIIKVVFNCIEIMVNLDDGLDAIKIAFLDL